MPVSGAVSQNSSSEDLQLLIQAQSGDRGAASRLMERHRPCLRRFFLRNSRTRQDAEDLEQETLTQAYARLSSYRGEGTFSGWLLGIANHLLLNYYDRTLRRRDRFVSLDGLPEKSDVQVKRFDREPCPYDSVESRDYVERLLDRVAQACTGMETQVIVLTYEGLNYEEVAALLGISQEGARQHFLRGREKWLAYAVEHEPGMLGGPDAINAAWERAKTAPESGTRPTSDEQDAWNQPRGKAKIYRKAVLKMARFLAVSSVIWQFLIREWR